MAAVPTRIRGLRLKATIRPIPRTEPGITSERTMLPLLCAKRVFDTLKRTRQIPARPFDFKLLLRFHPVAVAVDVRETVGDADKVGVDAEIIKRKLAVNHD